MTKLAPVAMVVAGSPTLPVAGAGGPSFATVAQASAQPTWSDLALRAKETSLGRQAGTFLTEEVKPALQDAIITEEALPLMLQSLNTLVVKVDRAERQGCFDALESFLRSTNRAYRLKTLEALSLIPEQEFVSSIVVQLCRCIDQEQGPVMSAAAGALSRLAVALSLPQLGILFDQGVVETLARGVRYENAEAAQSCGVALRSLLLKLEDKRVGAIACELKKALERNARNFDVCLGALEAGLTRPSSAKICADTIGELMRDPSVPEDGPALCVNKLKDILRAIFQRSPGGVLSAGEKTQVTQCIRILAKGLESRGLKPLCIEALCATCLTGGEAVIPFLEQKVVDALRQRLTSDQGVDADGKRARVLRLFPTATLPWVTVRP